MQDCFRENAQRFCWVNVSKADQNRVPGLTCVRLEKKNGRTENIMKILKKKAGHRHMTSFQIIILGFMGVILAGSLLLMMPWASRSGKWSSFSDTLFTATSAVCVTGLVVQDTATYWSEFGQLIILLLIQTGGLGVVTVAVSIATIAGRKIGLMQRSTMQEAIAAPKMGGIVRMTFFILKASFLIELLGAVLLFPVFYREFGLAKGLWYSVFHSISAFCNAGFDLMGVKGKFSSLTSFVTNPLLNMTIMTLIVVGGIGFFTWLDIRENKWHITKYRLQSKVVLGVSAFLIFAPAVLFFFLEFQDLPLGERIWSSLFQSVTTRTAGFNTADLAGMTDSGKMGMVLLMLIGGSPGSTAGGMKTTTAAVLFAMAISVFRKNEQAHLYNRRIAEETQRNAATIFVLYMMLFIGSAMFISYVEKVSLVTAFFETASAVGTVGLSLGLTPKLCLASRLILVCLMFFGRVGGLTLIFATISEKRTEYKYPQEKITVG